MGSSLPSIFELVGDLEVEPVERPSMTDRLGLGRTAIPYHERLSDGPTTRRGRPVGDSRDLRRILELPRRPEPDRAEADDLVAQWTAILKRPDGEQTLWRTQAWVLNEIALYGGILGGIPVGGGKTLLDLLAPMVIGGCKRAVLLIPASLMPQMRSDIVSYGKHWKLPNIAGGDTFIPGRPTLHIIPYSKLSHESATELLAQIDPDLVIADEGHNLRNHASVRTKRFVLRFTKAPGTRFLTWSGSLVEDKIIDYGHLGELALGDGSPTPLHYPTLVEWSKAIDPPRGAGLPSPPGELLRLCDIGEEVESGFRRRLLATPGVISVEQSEVNYVENGIEHPVRLTMRKRDPGAIPEKVLEALHTARKDWVRPDGENFYELFERSRCLAQLAAGFYHKWFYPRGEPEDLIYEWFECRQAWFAELREKLKRPRPFLDSPLWCTRAAIRHLAGLPAQPSRPVWKSEHFAAWREIHHAVQPQSRPVWIDDYLARDAAAWAQEHVGIVWTSHPTLGERISKLAKIPYLGSGDDESIKNETGKRSIVASIQAHGEGKNLQMFYKQLVANPPASGVRWEQLLGRLHRPKQLAHCVDTWVYQHTEEMRGRLETARERARYVQNTWSAKKKLLIADYID